MSSKRKRILSKNRKFAQISTLVVLLSLTSAFAIMHRFEIKMPEVKKIVFVDTGPVGPVTFSDPKPAPGQSPVPPIDLTSDIEADPDDIFTIEDFEDPVLQEAPKITFNGLTDPDDVIPFYNVQEKPVLSTDSRRKLSMYIYKNYPVLAKRSGMSGSVLLKFVCSKDGFPTNIRIINEVPENMGFGKVAVDALKQIRFTPGIQRDRAVNVSMSFPIKFTTKN